jgi:hypothetical protein
MAAKDPEEKEEEEEARTTDPIEDRDHAGQEDGFHLCAPAYKSLLRARKLRRFAQSLHGLTYG